MKHDVIEIWGYWNMRLLKYEVIEIWGYWNMMLLKYEVIEIWGYWNIRLLKYEVIEIWVIEIRGYWKWGYQNLSYWNIRLSKYELLKYEVTEIWAYWKMRLVKYMPPISHLISHRKHTKTLRILQTLLLFLGSSIIEEIVVA